MLTVNTILQERYRIVRQLGQGGMGAVYEAIDERIDKTVAIKEILLELEHSADKKQQDVIRQAFRREASSLVKARHAAVPDVTDYFSEFDREFLVMEFIEGDDLMIMLQKRRKPFLIDEVFLWIDQLLVALDYLHNLKPPIIHRDIKPQNLKLNEWNKMKLLDFGVAKSSDKSSTITQMTFIGATLSYSPIEQILRVIDPMFRELILLQHKEKAEKIMAQNTDATGDIFAIGATFYHLLTNYPPVEVTKRTLETWGGKEDPLRNPSKLNPDLPTSVSDWLLKAMAIEREDRFTSAIEMRKALHEAVNHENQGKAQETPAQIIKERKSKEKSEAENRIKETEEKALMQAKTVRLIDLPEIKEPLEEIIDDAIPLMDTASEISSSDTFSSIEGSSTDYSFTDTDISISKTSDNFTEISYVDREFVQPQNESKTEKFEFVTPSSEIPYAAASKKFNPVWIFPLVGILAVFVLGGGLFGIAMFMNYSGSSNENKSTFENKNAEAAKTQGETKTHEAALSNETNVTKPEANLKTVPESTPIVKELPNVPQNESPKINKTPNIVKPAPQPTPYPEIKKESKPSSTPNAKTTVNKKTRLSDDCIYNGRCD
jgi:serine/threonine protein kinase